ncbi:flagellar hook-basal body complex protein FliE [Virgibacillus halophilus]|uniref:Flagellar hook-basal body complex protein FliE n=1 Tax=Tigheibacillus halophilus TaxID=361280 RepID=A0ABU5CAK3_9BACI|nr:flagellar hook-basal body complex protein FliE [Virgibacillus halophilus]
MSISAVNVQNVLPSVNKQAVEANGTEKQGVSFADMMKSAVNQVNEAQIDSDNKTMALANGDINDLHDVMITAKKASITLQTAVQVQRKAVDAYNEMMRMQV